jgi:hypothetical protein
MPGKITLSQFQAVLRMLRARMRHVEIARELGLSVWTISRIAGERRFAAEDLGDADMPEDDGPPDYVARNLRRCTGCGAMVYVWPCLACRLSMVQQ